MTASGTLILALGNPIRGDDGVGLAVLDSLKNSDALPENATLLSHCGGGLLNMLLAGQYERVVIVDAAMMGFPPGEWRRFTLQEANLEKAGSSDRLSLHEANLAETISLASTLGIDLPEVIIYGVQPENLTGSSKISAPVKRAIPNLRDAILHEVSP
jgi:hydrogenase maturation protease